MEQFTVQLISAQDLMSCSHGLNGTYNVNNSDFYTDPSKSWHPSTVGYNKSKANSSKPHIRNSKQSRDLYYNKFAIIVTQEKVDDITRTISNITDKKYFPEKCLEYIFGEHDNGGEQWDFIKYTKGCFFKKHSDGQSSRGHIGNLLLIPPMCICPHIGGELVIYDNDRILSTISAHKTNWTCVAIAMKTPHEVLPVISGTRYVFKKKICIDEEWSKLVNSSDFTKNMFIVALQSDLIKSENPECESITVNCDFLTNKQICSSEKMSVIHDHICKMENKIITLRNISERIRLKGKIQKTLDNIQYDVPNTGISSVSKCVILKGYYPNLTDPENIQFCEEDITFISKLFTNHPNSTWKIRNDVGTSYIGKSSIGGLECDDMNQIEGDCRELQIYSHITKDGEDLTGTYDDSYYHYTRDKKITILCSF